MLYIKQYSAVWLVENMRDQSLSPAPDGSSRSAGSGLPCWGKEVGVRLAQPQAWGDEQLDFSQFQDSTANIYRHLGDQVNPFLGDPEVGQVQEVSYWCWGRIVP